MERLVLILFLALVTSGRSASIEKRSLDVHPSDEGNNHEIQTVHFGTDSDSSGYSSQVEDVRSGDVSEIDGQSSVNQDDHSLVNVESNGHEDIGYESAFERPTFVGEGIHAGEGYSNQHLGVKHGYHSHSIGNSAEDEQGKSIAHTFEDGLINTKGSDIGEEKEMSGGVSYQHVQTGNEGYGHGTIDSGYKVHSSTEDQGRLVESYGTYEEKDNDQAEILANDVYGGQEAEGHGNQYFFGKLLNHYQQEPEIHEVTKVIPVHETIKIPEPQKVQKLFRIPLPVKVLEPFPIKIPVPYAVEKTVHVPVEKIIKYQVIKPVPVKVEKKVPVPVPKPYPVPFPVYKLKVVIHSSGLHHAR